MNNMNNKGQGALEYLLLIGGAVLVAAIVIVLLLGINNTASTSTTNTAIGTLCAQKAAIFSQSAQACNKIRASPVAPQLGQDRYWDSIQNQCNACAGTYPNCTGAKANPYTDGATPPAAITSATNC